MSILDPKCRCKGTGIVHYLRDHYAPRYELCQCVVARLVSLDSAIKKLEARNEAVASGSLVRCLD